MNETRTIEKMLRTAVVIAATMLAVPALQAQGNKPENPGGGHGGGEAAVNNLSHPAVDVGAAGPSNAYFTLLDPGGLGVTYSYGCAKPDTTSVEGRTFDNTSCVSSDGNTFTAQRLAPQPGRPAKAMRSTGSTGRRTWRTTGRPTPSPARACCRSTRVDWADNLESKSWTSNSVIRVETTPFVNVNPQLKGLTMWHVFGQGTNELWGVRATEQGAALRLSFGLRDRQDDGDPEYREDDTRPVRPLPDHVSGEPPFGSQSWNSADQAWNGSWVLHQVPFQPELNIGGRYVYGFNWNLRKDAVPPEIGKGGWWRLTFHVPNGISFSDNPGDVGGEYFTAPKPPAGAPAALASAARLLAARRRRHRAALLAQDLSRRQRQPDLHRRLRERDQGRRQGRRQGPGQGQVAGEASPIAQDGTTPETRLTVEGGHDESIPIDPDAGRARMCVSDRRNLAGGSRGGCEVDCRCDLHRSVRPERGSGGVDVPERGRRGALRLARRRHLSQTAATFGSRRCSGCGRRGGLQRRRRRTRVVQAEGARSVRRGGVRGHTSCATARLAEGSAARMQAAGHEPDAGNEASGNVQDPGRVC